LPLGECCLAAMRRAECFRKLEFGYQLHNQPTKLAVGFQQKLACNCKRFQGIPALTPYERRFPDLGNWPILCDCCTQYLHHSPPERVAGMLRALIDATSSSANCKCQNAQKASAPFRRNVAGSSHSYNIITCRWQANRCLSGSLIAADAAPQRAIWRRVPRAPSAPGCPWTSTPG